MHLDCINDLRKRCPTCASTDDLETIPVEQASSDAQKKRTRESSTEKSSNKKAKKTGGKKVSSMLKKLIEELLTDMVPKVPILTAEESLEKQVKT